MKIITVVFFICSARVLFGQITIDFDTLNYEDRINGSIDSMDISGSNLPTTFDGGNSVVSATGLSPFRLFTDYTEPNFQRSTAWDKMEFSALPHLGFFYSFGGQGSQFLNAKYNHAFTKSTILQLSYVRKSGTGVIRNSGFAHNNVQLQLQHKGLHYTLQLKGSFQVHDVAHPGGLRTDTLIEDYGLDFSPVNKSNAHSKNKFGEVYLKNYFNFLSDSSSMLGLTTAHHYSIRNRVYTETDSLFGLYPIINIDSSETRDQYNFARIRNGGGVFFSSPKFYLDGIIDYSYWDYQNLGQHIDTSEVDLNSNARIYIAKLLVTNILQFNIAGAFNEWSNRTNLNFEKRNVSVNGFISVESTAPTPFKRRYFANNSDYTMSGLSNQQSYSIGGRGSLKLFEDKISIAAFGNLYSISNLFYFNGSEWKNDTMNRSFGSAGVEGAMRFGVFNFHPKLIYSFDTGGYLPDFQIYGRVFMKGKLFKAKKLEALLGCDFSYVTEFETKAYLPHMDTYNWGAATTNFSPMANLHAFVSLGIDEFRFFVRYENIGYYWNDRKTQVVSGYPIAGTRMRIGLSWDFFN